MARARLLKPSFFTNEDLLELPAFTRLLFAGLWTLADKAGRLEDRPKRIKIQLFPGDDVDVDEMLDALQERAFVQRYEVDGRRLIQITNFDKHQHPHHREPESTLPPPRGKPDSPRPALGEPEASPSEAVTGNGSIAEAEADTARGRARSVLAPLSEIKPVEERDFPAQYVWHYEQREGKHPGGNAVAVASELERKYGFAACVEVASDLDWEYHPNYYRPILEQRKNGPPPKRKRTGVSVVASSDPTGIEEWERYAAGE